MPTYLPLDEHVNVEVKFFPTPSIDPAHANTMIGGGDVILVYRDRPEVRELVKFLLSPEYGSIEMKLDPAILAANRRFEYEEDDWRNSLADALRVALAKDLFRFDGSDIMPPEVGTLRFWEGMVTYLTEGPESLDAVLADLEAAWGEVPDGGQ
jgi:alpha-glucoside transport system substrate-binding protein